MDGWNARGRMVEEAKPDFQSFSEEISNEPIPANYVFPKIGLFTGKQDRNANIKTFRAQMLIYGGLESVRCKMLGKTTLDWFSNLPEGSITSLEVFIRLFVSHFAGNKSKPPKITNLFEVRQFKGELVKKYLRCFNEIVVKIPQPNEVMCVEAFIRGLRSGGLVESLLKRRPEDMAAINLKVASYIKVEEFARKKK